MKFRHIVAFITLISLIATMGVYSYRHFWLTPERDMFSEFENGKATFCELDEMQKFYVCPKIRAFQQTDSGYIITYICDDNDAFVVVNAGFKAVMNVYRDMSKLKKVSVKIHCQDKADGEEITVFRMSKTGKINI